MVDDNAPKDPGQDAAPPPWGWCAAIAKTALCLGLAALAGCAPDRSAAPGAPAAPGSGAAGAGNDAGAGPGIAAHAAPTPYADPSTCQACHPETYRRWSGSQHADANRPFDPGRDGAAFDPPQETIHGEDRSLTRLGAGGGPEIVALADDGAETVYVPEAVVGIEPLRQYLVRFPGGRLQAAELAFDPARGDWFDVFGDEERLATDWGHWVRRGMNWNSQCAYCHMTTLDKGYDIASDSYHTTWDAHGIACKQCHGPAGAHAAAYGSAAAPGALSRPPTFDPAQQMANCAPCHARREELTGTFVPGEKFHDHYRVTLPDSPGIYYPDGQVREEDFEYGSFILSRMHLKGVTCMDCHDPHSAQLKIPLENNALCLSCHTPPGQRGALPVDPLTHGRHRPGSPGAACVGCHMPETTYMQRDPRRDHGFTVPDPLLTKELQIPNACNRCHQDKDVDWAVEWAERWYGEKLAQRRHRPRARAITKAHAGDLSAGPELLALARTEEVPAWRAVLISLLGPALAGDDVRAFTEGSLGHPDPLVRDAAVRTLGLDPGADAALRPLLKDPVRLVRLDAAWALRQQLDRRSEAYAELRRYLDNSSDQPAGALRQLQLAVADNRLREAEAWGRKAVGWDPNAGPLQHALAIVLNLRGKNAEAARSLLRAAELDPTNPEHPYSLSLLYAETGRVEDAAAALEKAVKLEPRFARAWYNLGLARNQLGDPAGAVEALRQAEVADPASPDFPYARATIHLARGEHREAREAALRTLAIDPAYAPAEALLRQLPPPP